MHTAFWAVLISAALMAAALMAALAVPMWWGRVPPNSVYGFRTPRIVKDQRLWYPANRIAGRNLFLAAIVTVVGALALFERWRATRTH